MLSIVNTHPFIHSWHRVRQRSALAALAVRTYVANSSAHRLSITRATSSLWCARSDTLDPSASWRVPFAASCGSGCSASAWARCSLLAACRDAYDPSTRWNICWPHSLGILCRNSVYHVEVSSANCLGFGCYSRWCCAVPTKQSSSMCCARHVISQSHVVWVDCCVRTTH